MKQQDTLQEIVEKIQAWQKSETLNDAKGYSSAMDLLTEIEASARDAIRRYVFAL